MSADLRFVCEYCGDRHEEAPLSFQAPAPDYWRPQYARRRHSGLSSDQCVIDDEHFFVRGLIEIPIVGGRGPFTWGVWVSLSRANFDRMTDLWDTPGRESEPSYFGWLSTELPVYPSTLNLKTRVHTRPVGQRPYIELEPTDHPLAVEQRAGISSARVRQLANRLLHEPNR